MASPQLSPEAQQAFCRDGFVVIDACLAPDVLRALEAECRALSHGVDLDETDCVVDLWAPQALGDHHPARTDPAEYRALRARAVARAAAAVAASKGGATDDAGPGLDGDAVSRVIFGEFASLATQAFRAILQESAASDDGAQAATLDTRLFNEHYVVKPAESAIEFGWHTDENEQLQMCLNKPGLPYVSLWVPLCDAGEENGTLEILPRSAPQPPPGADKSHPFFQAMPEAAVMGPGAGGADDEGSSLRAQRLTMRAGGAVLFASDVWHRSGANRSSTARQVFYAQYSCGVLRSDGTLGCPHRASIPASESRVADSSDGGGDEHVGGKRGREDRDCAEAAGQRASYISENAGVKAAGVASAVKNRRLTGPLSFAVPATCVD